MNPPGRRWPRPFVRSVMVLIGALSLASLLVGLVTVLDVYRVRTSGVQLEGTALGAAPSPGQIYVRFLVGDAAVLTTAESPTWAPPHGTRISLAYLASDPAASVRVIDDRAGGGYPVGLAGIVAGAGAAVALALAHRRSAAMQEETA